jgi:dienelactone hydrolase
VGRRGMLVACCVGMLFAMAATPAFAAPGVGLAPTSLSFTWGIDAGSSPAKMVTVSNSGDSDLIIGSLSVTGTDAADFSVSGDGCSGQTITPTSQCTFSVAFDPSATGAKSAAVSIPSNAATSPDQFALSGTGDPGAGTIYSVFNEMASPPVVCAVQTDPATLGQRWCNGTPSRVATWDNTPIDVSVTLPPAPASGPDGDFPIIGIYHGWNQVKPTPDMGMVQRFVQRGYAVFSMSDRGWYQSCGTTASRTGLPAWATCERGYIHLDHQAYEVRDAQYLVGELVDDGVADPNRIGATGGSYGGILSVQLAALNNRTRLPDGSLVPWASPRDGTPLHLAAAAPAALYSDFFGSLIPNGSTLDYAAYSPYLGPQGDGRPGIQKQQILQGFYGPSDDPTGRFYAPVGSDPMDATKRDPVADLADWKRWSLPPGPFDTPNFLEKMVPELTTYHSAYYIDDSVAPSPMILSNGFWDDFVPVDEVVRYYNKVRADHPETPIAMFFGDTGHNRSATRDGDLKDSFEDAWLDYYVKGVGPAPPQGLDVTKMTCPETAPTAGPFHFSSYADMEKGEVRLQSTAGQTVQPVVGTPLQFPVTADSCLTVDGSDNADTANYRTGAAPAGGYTLAGAVTVLAKFSVSGPSDQIAVRLFDVDSSTGDEQLIERGVFRPRLDDGTATQVFQLHPNVWRVAEGHLIKLELLPHDAPYSIVNATTPDDAAQHAIQVTDLDLRVPTMDSPGSAAGMVQTPAAKFLPPGYVLAPDFRTATTPPPTTTPPTQTAPGPTGQRARALKKCHRKKHKKSRRKCVKRAKKLPI